LEEKLRQLQNTLIQGQRLGGQGSYQRRMPSKKAVPFLKEALLGLRQYVLEHRDDAVAWRMFSQAEECFLHYTAARRALERVLALSPAKDRRDMRRLPLLKEQEERAADLGLTPSKRAELERYLDAKLSQFPCDHTLNRTREWLVGQQVDDPDAVLEAFRSYGGYCDCEVAMNVL
jgi:hypothetical protein